MITIHRIRNHYPKIMNTRKYHEEMERRKREMSEELHRENILLGKTTRKNK